MAYLIAFLATLPALLAAIYASADTALAPYLVQAWAHAPAGSEMLMGHAPFYSGYWILRLLHVLGDYRASAELTPWLFSAISSAIVGWAVARAAGRSAGLMVCAALVCVGSSLLALQFSWSIHGLAYVNVMLLGALAVWLPCDPAAEHPVAVGLIVMALTLLTATSAAGDSIVIIAGLVPFALTGSFVAWRAQPGAARRTTAIVLALVGGSAVGAALIPSVLSGAGLRATHYPVAIAPLADVSIHLRFLVQGLFSMLDAGIRQPGASPTGALGDLCLIAIAYLLILAALEACRSLARLIAPAGSGSGARNPSSLDARGVLGSYWALSAGLLAATYLFSTIGINIFTDRDLVTIAYALLILGITRGASLARRWQFPTAAAVTVLIVTATVAVAGQSRPRSDGTAPTPAMARAVARLARSERAAVVYAGYWDAYPLAWLSANAVPVYPVMVRGGELRAWTSNLVAGSGINTWYRPRPGVRSLLVLDSKLDASVYLPRHPPRSLGTPIARFSLDHGRLHAYLYDHDLAAQVRSGRRWLKLEAGLVVR